MLLLLTDLSCQSEANGPQSPVAPAPADCSEVCEKQHENFLSRALFDGQVPEVASGPRLLPRRPKLPDEALLLLEARLGELGTLPIASEPSPGSPPPPSMTVRRAVEGSEQLPGGAPEGFEDRHDLRFLIEPYVQVSPEGVATLRWQTLLPTPPGFVHFGLDLPEQRFDYPRWVKGSREDTRDTGHEHVATLTLSRIETKTVDLLGLAQRGGTVHYRIEFPDPFASLTLYRDGRFAYIKKDGVYANGVCIWEGPQLALVSPDGATISFETDVPTRAALLVQASGQAPRIFVSDEAAMRHELRADGLDADQVYDYRVGVVDARGVLGFAGDFSFRTAPAAFRPFTFAALCDSRGNVGGSESMLEGANARTLRTLMVGLATHGAEFVLYPGDLVSGFSTENRELELHLESFKRMTGPVQRYIPLYATPGNHDHIFDRPSGGARTGKPSPFSSEELFAREFVHPQNGPAPEREGAPPYTETAYSFDYANSHFVAVNSVYWMSSKPTASEGNRMGFVMDGQMRWLREDLRAARERGVDFVFVMTHVPGFPNGGHTGDAMWYGGKLEDVNRMRTEFWKMMGDFGVSAVFTGHEHSYNRLLVDAQMDASFTTPVWQIVTAGAGAPYYGMSNTPWRERVSVYSPEEHFVIVDVLAPGRARLRAIGMHGELIDELELSSQRAP